MLTGRQVLDTGSISISKAVMSRLPCQSLMTSRVWFFEGGNLRAVCTLWDDTLLFMGPVPLGIVLGSLHFRQPEKWDRIKRTFNNVVAGSRGKKWSPKFFRIEQDGHKSVGPKDSRTCCLTRTKKEEQQSLTAGAKVDPNKEIATHGSMKVLARVERLAASKTTLQSKEKETTIGTLQEQVKNNPRCDLLDYLEKGTGERIKILENPIWCRYPFRLCASRLHWQSGEYQIWRGSVPENLPPRPPPNIILKEAWQVLRDEQFQRRSGIGKLIADEDKFKIEAVFQDEDRTRRIRKLAYILKNQWKEQALITDLQKTDTFNPF